MLGSTPPIMNTLENLIVHPVEHKKQVIVGNYKYNQHRVNKQHAIVYRCVNKNNSGCLAEITVGSSLKVLKVSEHTCTQPHSLPCCCSTFLKGKEKPKKLQLPYGLAC